MLTDILSRGYFAYEKSWVRVRAVHACLAQLWQIYAHYTGMHRPTMYVRTNILCTQAAMENTYAQYSSLLLHKHQACMRLNSVLSLGCMNVMDVAHFLPDISPQAIFPRRKIQITLLKWKLE